MVREPASDVQTGAGAHWGDPNLVREYVERNDRATEMQAEIFALLAALLPFEREEPIRVLDIGAGYGAIAGAILDAYPNATAVGLDASEAMMEVGRERMARFGDRFQYFVGDFSGGLLPEGLMHPFQVMVSARAIHHLRSEGKRRFFADIYNRLPEGGCFVDLDNLRVTDTLLRQRYREARSIAGDPRGYRPRPADGQPREPRAPRPESEQTEFPDTLEDQLAWLRDAGFEHVECLWKRLDFAMMGAFK